LAIPGRTITTRLCVRPFELAALGAAKVGAKKRGPLVRKLEDQSFLLLLFAVTLAFVWILQPFYGPILWAVVMAVIFAPINRELLRSIRGRPTLAASITVVIIVAIVLLPLAIVATSLAQEVASLFAKIQSGEYDLAGYLQRIFDALPAWAVGLLDRLHLTTLSTLRETLAPNLVKGGQILAPHALTIGMNTSTS
jgi:predicted PurR-regulated permease PerM